MAARLRAAVAVLVLLVSAVESHGPRDHPKAAFRADALRVALDPAVRLQLNTTVFVRQRQVIEVSWSGVSGPSEHDLIAVYTPAFVVPWRTLPVQWVACSAADAGHLTDGAGVARCAQCWYGAAPKLGATRHAIERLHMQDQTAEYARLFQVCAAARGRHKATAGCGGATWARPAIHN